MYSILAGAGIGLLLILLGRGRVRGVDPVERWLVAIGTTALFAVMGFIVAVWIGDSWPHTVEETTYELAPLSRSTDGTAFVGETRIGNGAVYSALIRLQNGELRPWHHNSDGSVTIFQDPTLVDKGLLRQRVKVLDADWKWRNWALAANHRHTHELREPKGSPRKIFESMLQTFSDVSPLR